MANNKIKLMSFNTQHCLNYIERKIDFDIMAKAINDLGADVVGLNEMFDFGDEEGLLKQTERLAKASKFDNYFFAPALENEREFYGNGIISKIKIVSAERVLIPDPNPRKYNGYYETRCVLKARLENGLCVLITHFGLNPDEQENAVKTVVDLLENEKCVLMGDFNVTPDNPVLEPIRAKMLDTYTFVEGEKLSFPSDNPTIKIDYIFVSHDLKVLSADIPEVIASDHRPHVAEIEW